MADINVRERPWRVLVKGTTEADVDDAIARATDIKSTDIRPTIVFPPGEYNLANTKNFGDNVSVDASMATIRYTGAPLNEPFLTCGSTSLITVGASYKFLLVEVDDLNTGTYPNHRLSLEDFSGIRFLNIRNCRQIDINRIRNFHTGLQLISDSGGNAGFFQCYMNNFSIGGIINSRVGVHIHAETGWCNDNQFYGFDFQASTLVASTIGTVSAFKTTYNAANGAFAPAGIVSSALALQATGSGQYAETGTVTAGDRKFTQDVDGLWREYLALNDGSPSGGTPTHTTGDVAHGPITWRAGELYHRCALIQEGEWHTPHSFEDLRAEQATNPLIVCRGVPILSSSPDSKIECLNWDHDFRAGYRAAIDFETPQPKVAALPRFSTVRMGSLTQTLDFSNIEEKVIGSAAGWVANGGLSLSRLNANYDVLEHIAGANARLLANGYFLNVGFNLGAVFRTDLSGGMVFHSEWDEVAGRGSAVLMGRDYTGAASVAGENPLTMRIGLSTYTGAHYRLGDSSSSGWPRIINYTQDQPMIFVGSRAGNCIGMGFELIPGLTDSPEKERLTLVTPFGQERRSAGTPTVGVFPSRGEFIGNTQYVAGGSPGWYVSLSGVLTLPWIAGTPVVKDELRENGGRVYRAIAAGNTGVTAPTGTATVNDGVVDWDYFSDVAVLTAAPAV